MFKIPTLKKKKVFKKGGYYFNPNAGWAAIISMTGLIVCSTIVFGVHLFINTNRELEVPALPPAGAKTDALRDRTEKALGYFEARRETSEQIILLPAPVLDPSR